MRYSPGPMSEVRIERTHDKVRRGDLPPCPENIEATLRSGDGKSCQGCDEPIDRAEMMYRAVLYGVILRFHLVCYNAWCTFKR